MTAGTMDEDILNLFRILAERRIQRTFIFPCQSIQNRSGKASLRGTGLPPENSDSPFIDTQFLIRDHQIDIKFHLISKTQTLRAGTKWIIKGKTPGFDLINADATIRTGKTLAEIQKLPVHSVYYQQTIRQIQHGFNGIGKTLLYSRFHNKSIHNDLNVMFDILIQLDLLRKLIEISVDLHSHISASSGLIQKFNMGSLAAPHYRCKKLDLLAFRKRHDLIHHLIYRLFADFPSTFGTVRDSHTGIQKSEIIVDLRYRTHCRTGIPVR